MFTILLNIMKVMKRTVKSSIILFANNVNFHVLLYLKIS